MNKDFLLVKQKFIESLLSRYSFWFELTPHHLQTWTDNQTELRFSLMQGMPEPIVLRAAENLTIIPLVFDYLDVTIALKYGLSDEPFKTKLNILGEKLGNDFISKLTIATYGSLSKIRNKLLHQKGSLSECGKKIIIIKDEFSININSLKHINSVTSLISRKIKNENQLCLYEKSLIWSAYKLAFPDVTRDILESANQENVMDVSVSSMRHKIDMRKKTFASFEVLKDCLFNRFVSETGRLIGNTNFLFKYKEIEYSIPAEFLYQNPSINESDISIWVL